MWNAVAYGIRDNAVIEAGTVPVSDCGDAHFVGKVRLKSEPQIEVRPVTTQEGELGGVARGSAIASRGGISF